MKQNLGFDFSVDKENKTITVQREFAADRDLVWDAFTKSELLDQWWAPQPWKARTKTMDFKEGGTWLYAMVGPEGEEHWSFINYKIIDPKNYFTGLDGFSDADGNINTSLPQTDWRLNFSGDGDTTLVETNMQFTNLADLETLIEMGFKEGYKIAGDGLDVLLEKWKK